MADDAMPEQQPPRRGHHERHRMDRVGWLRAGVLGANDGILSTASLVVGVAASGAPRAAVLLAGAAGLVSGAMSMAAGEYVSVSSQKDTEKAERDRERRELERDPEHELRELAAIYETRGVEPVLARRVAEQMSEHDALGAHMRDELGITDELRARPLQAAAASALSFAAGAALPLGTAALAPADGGVSLWIVSGAALCFLALLGAVGARIGGAPLLRATLRVFLGGALAMAATALVGSAFGTD